MSDPRPSIGQIVHYNGPHARGVDPVAAIVTFVFPVSYGPDAVSLTIFPAASRPEPIYHAVHKGTAPGTWCWPPAVPLAQIPR